MGVIKSLSLVVLLLVLLNALVWLWRPGGLFFGDLPTDSAELTALARDLEFSRDDLELNRKGEVAWRQYRPRLLDLLLSLSFVAVGAFAFHEQVTKRPPSDRKELGVWILKIAGCTAGTLLAAFVVWRVLPGLVSPRAAFTIGPLEKLDQTGSKSDLLTVSGVTVSVPRVAALRTLRVGKSYRAYYWADDRRLLSIEPAE